MAIKFAQQLIHKLVVIKLHSGTSFVFMLPTELSPYTRVVRTNTQPGSNPKTNECHQTGNQPNDILWEYLNQWPVADPEPRGTRISSTNAWICAGGAALNFETIHAEPKLSRAPTAPKASG